MPCSPYLLRCLQQLVSCAGVLTVAWHNDANIRQPDSCLVSWSALSVWYREAVCAMCFDELSRSSRKSSLPVKGGNINNCDLWLCLHRVPYIACEYKTTDVSLLCLCEHTNMHTNMSLTAKAPIQTAYRLTGSLVVIMVIGYYFTVSIITMDPMTNLDPWCKSPMINCSSVR